VLVDVQLIEENGAVYAECDNAAERLLLAVGGASMGRIAGEGFEPSIRAISSPIWVENQRVTTSCITMNTI